MRMKKIDGVLLSKKRSFWKTPLWETIGSLIVGVLFLATAIGLLAGIVMGSIAIAAGMNNYFGWNLTKDDLDFLTLGVVAGMVVGLLMMFGMFVFIKDLLATLRCLYLPLKEEEIKALEFDSIKKYVDFIMKLTNYWGDEYLSLFTVESERFTFYNNLFNTYFREIIENPIMTFNDVLRPLHLVADTGGFSQTTLNDVFKLIQENFSDLDSTYFYDCKENKRDEYESLSDTTGDEIEPVFIGVDASFVYDNEKLIVFYNNDDVLCCTLFPLNGEAMSDAFAIKCLKDAVNKK